MPSRNIDERYPAMFQPGGEAEGTAAWAPGTDHADSANDHVATVQALGGQQVPAPEREADSAKPGGASNHPAGSQASRGTGSMEPQPQPWTAGQWLGPLAAALAMIAGGVFSLTAQYWLPSATKIDPSNFGGVELQPWGLAIVGVAPALFVAGSVLLGGRLFFGSRRSADREPALRGAFVVLTAALGVAGWVGMFASSLFPQVMSQIYRTGRPSAMPWTHVVGGSGIGLFILALVMGAVFMAVPPRGHRARPLRVLVFGAALAAVGMYALFAPYLYPTATGTVIVELSTGAQATRQGWAALAPQLATPVLVVGFAVIGWALLANATAPRRGLAAEGGPSAVVPGNEET